jgi:hypothetical protein
MAQEKIFAEGILFKRNEKAPEYVIGNVSVKLDEAIPFLQANAKNGWTNLSIMLSKGGKYYIQLDTYESKGDAQQAPQQQRAAAPAQPVNVVVDDEELPF